MLVFSEYQTGTIDLSLSFYGYEECTPNYSFGPAIRDTYVLHYITKGKGQFHYKGKIVDLKAGDFFLLKPDELTFYQADNQDPWAYYWLGITGGRAPDYFALSQISDQSYLIQSKNCHTQTTAKLIENIDERCHVVFCLIIAVCTVINGVLLKDCILRQDLSRGFAPKNQ